MDNEKTTSIKLGPWGGNGGKKWDDDGTYKYNGVREIIIIYGGCIDSLRAVYDSNGEVVPAKKHGGIGGDHKAEIKLEFPEEYIVGVSGHIGVFRSYKVIRSLTIRSNKRTYGPYGTEEGTEFDSGMSGGFVVGFYGRGDGYLDAIGVRVSTLQSLQPKPKLVDIGVQKNFHFENSTFSGNVEFHT